METGTKGMTIKLLSSEILRSLELQQFNYGRSFKTSLQPEKFVSLFSIIYYESSVSRTLKHY